MKMKTLFKSISLMLVAVLSAFAPQYAAAQSKTAEQRSQEISRRAAVKAQRQAAPPTMRVVENAPTLYGYIYDSYGTYYSGAGIYSLDINDASNMSAVAVGKKAYAGGTYGNKTYYALDYKESGSQVTFPATLTLYDTQTWEVKERMYSATTNFNNLGADITFDPTSGSIYGIFDDAVTAYAFNVFGRIKMHSPVDNGYEVEAIATLPERMVAIACNKDGVIYAIGKSRKLYTINKSTGAATEIGTINVPAIKTWKQSACCDMETGVIYWTTIYEYATAYYEFGLWMIDPATAQATLIGDYGENGTYNEDYICGLTTFQDVETQTAPAPITTISAAFVNDALTGTISFTMPATDADGAALAGTLGYNIMIDGTTAASGTVEAGSTVTETVSVAEAGLHTVTVVISKGTALSAPYTVQGWIGEDSPAKPSTVTATLASTDDAGSHINISWTAGTRGEHDGYIDAAQLTYTVTRQPDGVTVYTGADKTCTDLITSDVKTTYTYNVVTNYKGQSSEAKTSNTLQLGTYQGVPYTQNFDAANALDGWVITDNNSDGSTWELNGGRISYKYNTKNAADDWAFTPGIKLEAGNLYHLSFTAYNTSLDEAVAGYVGREATPAAMTTELIAPTVITYEPRMHYLRGSFKPTETGVYYFAVKACSPADMSTVYVDDVAVTVTPATAPGKPENLLVTPGERGALSATIAFNAPSKAINGSTLASLDCCVVERDGTEIARITDVTPGQAISVNDTEGVSQDTHTYKIYSIAGGVTGDFDTQSKYIGLDAPGPVRNLKATEDLSDPGTVVLTWDAPDTGQHGGYIDPAGLLYEVSVGYSSDEYGTSETTFRDKLDISGGQAYQGYSVYALNNAGSGRYVWKTVVAIAGAPYEAPLTESFAGVHMTYAPWLPEMAIGEIGEARWTPCDGSATQAGTQDGDGGVIAFSTSKLGVSSRIISPKIDISKMSKPQLSSWIYLTGKSDQVRIEISVEHGDYQQLKLITLNQDTKGWHRFTADLTPYKDSQFVRIAFTGISVESTADITSFDNFAITEAIDYDLQAGTLTAPEKIKVGEQGTFTFQLRNSGNKALRGSGYEVELYKNGKLCSTTAGKDIAVGATLTLTLTDTPTILDEEISLYSAKINCTLDENSANNESNSTSVEIIMPQYPRVSGLTGECVGNAVKLLWEEPDFADMPATSVTERFETYEAFAIANIGDWKVIDRDGQNTIKITLDASFGPLEYPNAGAPMAFQVFNSLEAGIPFSTWDAHSGDQMLVAFKCASPDEGQTETPNDDWLISPELNGAAQTISFYAKTGMGGVYTPESFEVLYSTTTPTVEAFTKIGDTYDIANVSGWEEFKVELPEGARYFAIRCVSDSKFALMLDDITYIPVGATTEELSLVGYNVYRDGVKANAEPLPETVWYDDHVTEGTNYSYQVTAVYDKGESQFSEALQIVATGINRLTSQQMRIGTAKGCIVVQGANGLPVEVFATDGRRISSLSGNASNRIATGSGIYVVRIGGGKGVTVRVP